MAASKAQKWEQKNKDNARIVAALRELVARYEVSIGRYGDGRHYALLSGGGLDGFIDVDSRSLRVTLERAVREMKGAKRDE